MQEPTIRKIHRYIGVVAAPLVVVQAVSGLVLGRDVLFRLQGRVHEQVLERHFPALAEFWNYLLLGIHYGGGAVGRAYHLALVAALLTLVVTGGLVFIKVEARLRRRNGAAEPTAPARARPAGLSPAGTPPLPPTPERVRRRVYAALAAATLTMLSFTAYVFYGGYRVAAVQAPLLHAALEVRLQVTRAHLWLEEILAGDSDESLEAVWDSLEQAERVAGAMMEGGRRLGLPLLPLEDPALRARIVAVQQRVQEVKDLTVSRFVDARGAGPGSPQDLAYDAAYQALDDSAQEVERALGQALEADRDRFLATLVVLLSAGVLAGLVLAVVFYRFEEGRGEYLRALDSARRRAEAGEALFHELVDHAPDPLFILDEERTVRQANRLACAWLGRSRDDLVGHPIGAALAEEPADLDRVWAQMEPLAPLSLCLRFRRADGSPVRGHLDASVISWNGGRFVLWVARPAPEAPAAQGPGFSPPGA
ncbi:MAG: PAS domain-containing protein [Deferrisomatales bacterium]